MKSQIRVASVLMTPLTQVLQFRQFLKPLRPVPHTGRYITGFRWGCQRHREDGLHYWLLRLFSKNRRLAFLPLCDGGTLPPPTWCFLEVTKGVMVLHWIFLDCLSRKQEKTTEFKAWQIHWWEYPEKSTESGILEADQFPVSLKWY